MYGSKRVSASKRATPRRIVPLQRRDRGPKPCVIAIEKETTSNKTYRTAVWTGAHLQVTLMSINVGDDVGLERHADTDQFLRIEEGEALVQVGKTRNQLKNMRTHAKSGDAILIPAGTWHNVINVGTKPLKYI
jgi:mannose-6-phosphate isomerase-like protein (cupin superfamily)